MPSPESVAQQLAKLRPHTPQPDPWGLDLAYCQKLLRVLTPLYRHYFKVRVFGAKNLANKPYLLVSNHSGQVAIDGLLIGIALATDAPVPRIVRPMIERFMAQLPFVADAAFRAGAVLGERQNCLKLLERGHSVLVFPEGVRGVAKSTSQFYQLQPFTQGFFRMALASGREVVPIAVVGAEELYPFVYQARGLAHRLGLPALPITPLFPWLGPLGMIPMPSPIDIHIGVPFPMPSDLDENAPDHKINPHIFHLEKTITHMLKAGVKKQRKFIEPQKILRNLGIKL